MDSNQYWRQRATPELVATYRKCAWCKLPIRGINFERHHWLIKRSNLPKRLFPVIDVLINVVPLHHNCHQQHGQEPEMISRCLDYVSKVYGETAVQTWYDEVAEKTNLPEKELYENRQHNVKK